MLLIIDENDKLRNPDDYDQIVRAEIPAMIHGPYGIQNPRSPCMKNGKCKKGYLKPFLLETYQGNDSYPVYKRCDTINVVPLNDQSNIMVDNR
jgi:hypothetical protein